MNFRGKHILIVGFGVSGQAAARFLTARGAKVSVTDSGHPDERLIPKDLRGLEFHFGGHAPELFRGKDLIVLSPGVPANLPGIQLARRRRIPVVGEFGLAAKLLKSKMVAVTGTNGKSTTVTLIYEMLKAAGKKAALAGNIGTPLMEVVMEIEGSDKNPAWPVRGAGVRGAPEAHPHKIDWVIAEASSYQLETVVSPFRPKISVLLNITEDHLDRYATFMDYARAKFRIFRDQKSGDVLVYNEADSVVKKGARKARSKKIGFPKDIRDTGSTIVFGKEIYPLDRVKLVGAHNRENMAAAIAAARSAGASQAAVQKTLETFRGLPHRTQLVSERSGVRYYDDSKGTNVDAVVKSLEGFPDGRVILIAGGRDKGGSYEPLRSACGRKAKLVIVLGEARKKIAEALKGAVSVEEVERMEQAVPMAAERAETGDVVLLSPACSSFDQFKDYKERGDVFRKLVLSL